MKNRYTKFLFKDAKGKLLEKVAADNYSFCISEDPEGRLIIEERPIKQEHFANPPILDGYTHVFGEWNTGFVIQRISDGSMLTWVPVGWLEANGTLNGFSYNEKFGRRQYGYKLSTRTSPMSYRETFVGDLEKQKASVEKYGGFYVTTYNLSVIDNEILSVKDEIPFQDRNIQIYKQIAENFEQSVGVSSHLLYGAEFDTILEWFVQSGARSVQEIHKDSTLVGNYNNTPNSFNLARTGEREEWGTLNIYDLAGNYYEVTQEKYEQEGVSLRGGYFKCMGNRMPMSSRTYVRSDNIVCAAARAAICIE